MHGLGVGGAISICPEKNSREVFITLNGERAYKTGGDLAKITPGVMRSNFSERNSQKQSDQASRSQGRAWSEIRGC